MTLNFKKRMKQSTTQVNNVRLLSSKFTGDHVLRGRPDEGKGPVPGRHNDIEMDDYLNERPHGAEDEDDEEIGKQPWRTLLEGPARAKWRASSEYPPEHLFLAQESILEEGARTRKQLRSTFQRIQDSHDGLAELRERERRRVTGGKKTRVDSLAYKSESQNNAVTVPIYYTPDFSLASLHHRLLPNYAVITRVMEETKSLLGPNRFQPKRVVDFGIGCGAASAAALDAFPTIEWIHGIDPSQSMRDCAKLLIEDIVKNRNPSTRLTLGESLTADSTNAGSFDLAIFAYTATELPLVASTLASAAALWEKLKPNGIFIMIEPGTPDGFNSIRSVRTMLLDCCPPEGDFDDEMDGDDECHIIAPCTHNGKCPMQRHQPPTNKRSLVNPEVVNEKQVQKWTNAEEFYDQVVDDEDVGEDTWELLPQKQEDRVEEFNIEETNVFGSSFCSFVHTIPGGGNRRGEKFSYLVAQKRILGDLRDIHVDKENYSFSDVNVVELMKDTYKAGRASSTRPKHQRRAFEEERHVGLISDAHDLKERFLASKEDPDLGLELLRGEARRSSFGRIIRAPIKKKGHIVVDYCSVNKGNVDKDGRIIRHKVSKGFSSRVVPGQFQAARKARWGGLWPDLSSATVDLESTSNDERPKEEEKRILF